MVDSGCNLHEGKFVIANIEDDCILGLDLMRKYGLIVDLEGWVLRGPKGNMPLFMLKREESAVAVKSMQFNSNLYFESAQQRDEDIATLLSWKHKGERPTWQDISARSVNLKILWAQWDSLVVEGGVLYRVWESVDDVIVWIWSRARETQKLIYFPFEVNKYPSKFAFLSFNMIEQDLEEKKKTKERKKLSKR